MTKEQIGKELAKYRKKSSKTQREISQFLNVSLNAVYEWEAGISMPTGIVISKLANLYGVSVDDILEGEKMITKENLLKKYPYLMSIQKKIDYKFNYYESWHKSTLRIHKRIRELVIFFYKRFLTRNENIELQFLFENTCSLSNYYYDFYEIENKIKKDEQYVAFVNLLNSIKCSFDDANAYLYEVFKFFKYNDGHYIMKPYPEYGEPNKDKIGDESFKLLEQWEKDAYLALIQNNDIIAINPYRIDEYEEEYGKNYNQEECVKSLIKYFINNGAFLNSYFLTFINRKEEKYNILLSLEDIYINYIKPIFIKYYSIEDEGRDSPKYSHIENNIYNYFLANYYEEEFYPLLLQMSEISPKECFDIYSGKIEELDRNLIQDNNFNKRKENFKKYIKNREELLRNLEELENKLRNGEKYFVKYVDKDITEEDGFNHLYLINQWKNSIDYNEFLSYRNKKMTQDLLNNIDNLSLKEIREKYFPKEVIHR